MKTYIAHSFFIFIVKLLINQNKSNTWDDSRVWIKFMCSTSALLVNWCGFDLFWMKFKIVLIRMKTPIICTQRQLALSVEWLWGDIWSNIKARIHNKMALNTAMEVVWCYLMCNCCLNCSKCSIQTTQKTKKKFFCVCWPIAAVSILRIHEVWIAKCKKNHHKRAELPKFLSQ